MLLVDVVSRDSNRAAAPMEAHRPHLTGREHCALFGLVERLPEATIRLATLRPLSTADRCLARRPRAYAGAIRTSSSLSLASG
jgi:hypothetical protein